MNIKPIHHEEGLSPEEFLAAVKSNNPVTDEVRKGIQQTMRDFETGNYDADQLAKYTRSPRRSTAKRTTVNPDHGDRAMTRAVDERRIPAWFNDAATEKQLAFLNHLTRRLVQE